MTDETHMGQHQSAADSAREALQVAPALDDAARERIWKTLAPQARETARQLREGPTQAASRRRWTWQWVVPLGIAASAALLLFVTAPEPPPPNVAPSTTLIAQRSSGNSSLNRRWLLGPGTTRGKMARRALRPGAEPRR